MRNAAPAGKRLRWALLSLLSPLSRQKTLTRSFAAAGKQQTKQAEAPPAPKVKAPVITVPNETQLLNVARKYNYVDFNELRAVLAEADHEFFQFDEPPALIPTRRRVVKKRVVTEEERELEKNKLEKLLHVKWKIASYQRSRLCTDGYSRNLAALVLAGNANGVVGYGYGKGVSRDLADARAKDNIRKNLVYVPLWEGRTIFQAVVGKHNQTKVILRPAPRGHGIVAGRVVRAVAESAGILDLTSKVIGNRNRYSVIYAMFDALKKQKSFRQIAMDSGLNYYKAFDPAVVKEAPPTQQELRAQGEAVREVVNKALLQWQHRRLDQRDPKQKVIAELFSENSKKILPAAAEAGEGLGKGDEEGEAEGEVEGKEVQKVGKNDKTKTTATKDS